MCSEESVTLSGLISYLWNDENDHDNDEEEQVDDSDNSYKVLSGYNYIIVWIYSILKWILWR